MSGVMLGVVGSENFRQEGNFYPKMLIFRWSSVPLGKFTGIIIQRCQGTYRWLGYCKKTAVSLCNFG